MKLLKNIDKSMEEWLLVFFLANIVFWVFFQVIMRYVFSNSLSWSEEFVRWCFVWFIWVGVSYGFKCRKHIAVTALTNLFPKNVQNIISIVVDIIVLWCMVKMFLYGWNQIMSPIIARQSSVILYWPLTEIRVSMQWLYASLPLGALLSSLRLVQNIVADIRGLLGKKHSSHPQSLGETGGN